LSGNIANQYLDSHQAALGEHTVGAALTSESPKKPLSAEHYRGFVGQNKLFSGLDERGMTALLELSHVRQVSKQHLVFMTDDAADYFYLMIDGWMKLFRQTRDGYESVLSVFTNGEVFGKAAALKQGNHAYCAQAVTDATLLQIPSNFMTQMLNDHDYYDDLLDKLLQADMAEIAQRQLEAEHLIRMSSAQRVGCFLLRMCGERREGDIILTFPYEKALVAGRLGMTPETLSRSLNQLTEWGVETDQAEVTIHNIALLKSRICEFCSATKNDCHVSDDETTLY
jgi:CRP-like cAMP-binding protein